MRLQLLFTALPLTWGRAFLIQRDMSFTHILPEAFSGWIEKQHVKRSIRFIQQHHTYSPAYRHFTGSNHLALQKGMQNFHKNVNGWQDIGQHFTIFPDGTILTGRSLDIAPACIYGANSGAICIENLGNFDAGEDEMADRQRSAIITVTAALCRRFGVPADTEHIVYHHWFDLSTGKRTNGSGMTKTCPGTAFFGGNTVEAAQSVFLPEVQALLSPPVVEPVIEEAPEPEVVVAPAIEAPQRPALPDAQESAAANNDKPPGCLFAFWPGLK